jgi:hypothetical protein
MDCHKKNFEVWYKAILEGLYSNRNAGFVILMVAFPLLERYLREKSGLHDGAAVSLDSNGDFWVHPSNFAKRVIDTIEKDFATFEAQHSPGYPLPTVHQFPTILGTGAPQ